MVYNSFRLSDTRSHGIGVQRHYTDEHVETGFTSRSPAHWLIAARRHNNSGVRPVGTFRGKGYLSSLTSYQGYLKGTSALFNSHMIIAFIERALIVRNCEDEFDIWHVTGEMHSCIIRQHFIDQI